MHSETVGERIRHLIGDRVDSPKVPRWPPDVFAVCASLLMCSGAYSLVVDDKPIQGRPEDSEDRALKIGAHGKRWRDIATNNAQMPVEIQAWWDTILNCRPVRVAKVSGNRKLCLALLDLLATADAASFDVGIFFPSTSKSPGKDPNDFVSKAERRLIDTIMDEQGSTLCMDVHQSKARVLPKMHTPQNGLTVRSLSHNLAFCVAPDVSPRWLSASVELDDHFFNLLVVPWPAVINPSQFESSRKVLIKDKVEGGSYGLFTYKAAEGPTPEYVASLIEDATKRIGRVDGIVFPELSMSEAEFVQLAKSVGNRRFLVAGIGSPALGPYESGKNEAVIRVRLPVEGEGYTRFHQAKHHRWKLTKSQILQYGIGQNLHPETNWWEHILLERRTLSFVTLRPWLTTSVLICEDLCRPDPMGDILRAVGPNLIIALLCDAPQLIGRWPGRYAGAFADDPGSSVLTLTSAGMANLSQPQPGRTNRSRTVALWRDAKSGTHELELPSGSDAILLNLTVEFHEEWTADGRRDGGASGYPVLAAYHPIFASSKTGEKKHPTESRAPVNSTLSTLKSKRKYKGPAAKVPAGSTKTIKKGNMRKL